MNQERLQQYLQEARETFDLPGLSLTVRMDGEVFDGAAGVKEIRTGALLLPDTIFHMASVAKLFTSAAVLCLAADGKLSLDERLVNVLPWVRIRDARLRDVKLWHMLSHTSGLADVTDYHWDRPRTDPAALREWCASPEVSETVMLWHPDENRFRYSNMAFELLGCVVEECTGMSFESYIRQRFFCPLSMERSTFLTMEQDWSSMAMPHEKNRQHQIVPVTHYPYNREHAPSSTLTSCGSDLAAWAEGWLHHTVLPSEWIGMAWTQYVTVPNHGEGMGLGWFLREQNGFRLMGHEGSDDGFRSSFWICPERQGMIAVMSNLSNAPVKKINKQVFDLLCDRS